MHTEMDDWTLLAETPATDTVEMPSAEAREEVDQDKSGQNRTARCTKFRVTTRHCQLLASKGLEVRKKLEILTYRLVKILGTPA